MQQYEQDFIEQIDRALPKAGISKMFKYFSRTKEENRVYRAWEMLHRTTRRTFEPYGVFSNDQVSHHVSVSGMLVRTELADDDPKKPYIEKLLAIHCHPKAITSDLIADFDLPESDKIKIEQLAADIIFQDNPKLRAMFDEYQRKNTPNAYIAHKIQRTEEMMKASRLTKDDKNKTKLDDYWKDAAQRFNTRIGRKLVNDALRSIRTEKIEFTLTAASSAPFRIEGI